MMFSKKKRKAKKQAKLEAAQRAAMNAALQGIPSYEHGAPHPRPPSVMSVPVFLHTEEYQEELEGDNSGGSDEDGVHLDSASLSLGPSMMLPEPPQNLIVSSPSHTVQSSSVSQQQSQAMTMQQPPQPSNPGVYTLPHTGSTVPAAVHMPTPSTPSYQTSSTMKELRRGMSQPALYIPPSTSVSVELPFHPALQTIPSSTAVTLSPPVMPAPQPMYQPPPPPTPATTASYSQRNVSVKPSSNGYATLPLKQKKASTVPKIDPAKASQISLALSMGLGRGVDATSKTPWASKGSFQVRRVHNSIVETNEGSCTNSYDHEIVGVTEMEQSLQASLDPPENPVVINVEAEANRNINSSRRIVGKKVVTRTLSFQTDFEEKYIDGDSGRGTSTFLIPRDPAEVVYNTQNSSLTFEERVCQWLLHRIGHKYAIAGQKLEIRGDESPVDQLAKMLHQKSVPKGEEEVINGCKELIGGLRTTHYVTSITLGAAEYRIMSTGEYHKKLAEGGAFGIDTLATSATGEMIQTKKEATKCSQLRKLGVINEEGQVTPQNEVVLNVQLQPITRLVRLPAVKSAMKSALAEYMKKAPVKQEGGPFVIKCTGKNIYVTVNKFNNYEVEGTETPEEASLFYFKPTDDGGNPFDFNIVYHGEDVGPTTIAEEKELDPIGRYLEAPINGKGYCAGPLLMKHCVKVRNTRFTLRSRLSKKYSQSHLSEWTTGEDAFYIACATKKTRHGSYLAIKNAGRTSVLGKHFFITACLPSIHHHNGDNVMMLFQLVPKDKMAAKTEGGRETPGKLPSPPNEITTKQ